MNTSLKQGYKEAVDDAAELTVAIGIFVLMLVRWPYAWIWLRKRNSEHDWHHLSHRGQIGFVCMCIVAACMQIGTLTIIGLYMLGAIITIPILPTMIMVSTYTILTFLRFLMRIQSYEF